MSSAEIESKLRALGQLAVANVTWRGRASRKTLFISIGLLYLFGALSFPLSILEMLTPPSGPAALLLKGVTICVALPIGAFCLGAFVRRLHDRGKASWWLLLFLGPHVAFVMLLNLIPPETPMFKLAIAVGMIIDFPLVAWWMVETFFLRGAIGPNRFGQDPLATSPIEEAAAPA